MTGTHLVAFHELPPPSTYGAHFSPSGQSCLNVSHSFSVLSPPVPVVSQMNPQVSSDVVVVDPGLPVVVPGCGSVVPLVVPACGPVLPA